jgi:FdhE protein
VSALSQTATSPWAARRLRADALRVQYPFAAQVLTLYLALLPVQENAWRAVREDAPPPEELPRWAAARVVPAVAEATVAAGPELLRDAVPSRLAEGSVDDALAGWLSGSDLDPVDRYLARASLGPVLEALGDRAGATSANPENGAVLCPSCGGFPQLSCIASSGESLVTGPRSLVCARCAGKWTHTRSACPACGEADEGKLVVYTERWHGPVSANGNGDGGTPPVFPHLRIAGCTTCRRYLIEVDMEQDPRAVPEVDELAAIPLDLYAAEQELMKVTPNLMGF